MLTLIRRAFSRQQQEGFTNAAVMWQVNSARDRHTVGAA